MKDAGDTEGGKRTGAGAGASVFVSDEGSTTGVTSVGLSSDLGTSVVVGCSDIMLWNGKSWRRNEQGREA